MAASASASSSQVPCEKYDVFISFRGSEVRSGFLSHLKNGLHQKNIDVYVDDRLERGEEIWSSLVNAIEGSMIALVIFSKDYAYSKWCLEELAKIMERNEANQLVVMPIFYHVDPSDVRHQKHTYADAFTHHEHKFKDNMNNLQTWRSILKKTADLSGYHSSNFQEESKLIDAIVEDVLKKLEGNTPIVPKSLVGFHQNFTNVESLMDIEAQLEVRILGIWGMAGIGKTTLAHAIFDKFLSRFEGCCFIENVKEESRIKDLHGLLERILSKLIHQEGLDINVAMRRLRRKKVLIVLDDVDDPNQLKYLAGQQLHHLGLGSRVIATSRDKHVLKSGGIQDKDIHEVKELNFEESLELFSIHAFKQSHPNIGYEQLSEMTVAIVEGIPLALEVLGSHFHSRDKAYWESELSKLQKYPHRQIQDKLNISYDGLDPIDKEIFLDIAFFFVGGRKDEITFVLKACGFSAVSGIQNLIDKALIKSNEYECIVMHDLIQEMAKQIVRKECMKHPERRSRLEDADEICDMLENDMGTDEIEGIILDMSRKKNLKLKADVFTKIKNLRILKFFHRPGRWPNTHIELPSGLESFPNKLRYFLWGHYPLKSLPLGSCSENLVELHMPRSKVKKLWDGKQDLANLKTIRLSMSPELMELPDLSMAHKLENVYVDNCRSLRSVHPSILSLHTIVEMYINSCPKLQGLESETHLESLSILMGSHSYSLKRFCLSSKKLKQIYLDGNRLRSLPIDKLCCSTNLEEFEVPNFKQAIHTMELQSLFDAWDNLTYLCLSGWSYLLEIPNSINHLSNLKRISLRRCKSLKSILGLPPSLEELKATECTSLETVSSDSLPLQPCSTCFHNCVKLDERSLRFIEELTHFSIISACEDYHYHAITCYPGSRVPEWMKYKPTTEASNVIEFTCNLQRSRDILFCCVAPGDGHVVSNRFLYVSCECSWDDKKFRDSYHDYIFLPDELNSDHVFLWYIHGGLSGAKISCEFFEEYFNEEERHCFKVPAKACGVHVIYYSESELESDFELELESGVEGPIPPTKKLKHSGVFHDDFC